MFLLSRLVPGTNLISWSFELDLELKQRTKRNDTRIEPLIDSSKNVYQDLFEQVGSGLTNTSGIVSKPGEKFRIQDQISGRNPIWEAS